MNYLAHAFLSKNDKDLLIGNFIADHLRGNDFTAYPAEVVAGIRLHREIDAFTDAHPEFKKSKRVFYNGFERYSGILVDIYFDYFLAKDFTKYADIPLETFSGKVYKIYTAHKSILPTSSSGFLDYVITNNIYTAYATLPGIQKVLYHLSHRIKHNVRLDASVAIFKENEKILQANFDLFFRDVLKAFPL